MSELLEREDFAKCLNDKFQVEFIEGISTSIELVEVSEYKDFPGQKVFSLVFLAPSDTPTDTNIYKMSHTEIGDFEISLSPFAKDDKGVSFEAVFSKLET